MLTHSRTTWLRFVIRSDKLEGLLRTHAAKDNQCGNIMTSGGHTAGLNNWTTIGLEK